jgi:hypothetical protein
LNNNIQTQEEILARYSEGRSRLEEVVAGLSEDELNLTAKPGSWTIRQIVHHIVDGDDLWRTCIKAALGNGRVEFSLKWYWDIPQDQWADCWSYARRPIQPALAIFRLHREQIVDLLGRIPDAWEKPIRVRWPHKPEEIVKVGNVIEMQAGHALGHIEDIRRILGEAGLHRGRD